MASSPIQQQWLTQLAASSERTIERVRAGQVDSGALRSVADLEAFFALNLAPMPIDPVAHIRVGYAKTRPHLERLPRHDPTRIVPISGRDGYVYPMTPRKVLRRVLDHLLDHLNQIDQWIAWQDHGIVPVPTDGWAPSAVTLDDDTLPLTEADLSAWLWRIDLVVGLLTTRASHLTPAQWDWQPPDDGWNLRRVIHHVARTYGYAAWLDEALPDAVETRYTEANRRLRDRFVRLITEPPPPDTAFYMAEGRQFTPAEALHETLEAEEQLQTGGILAPATSAGGV
ncbi:MAG: hypothetical protein ACR2JW_15500 [Thermomicrobiales bacterium]